MSIILWVFMALAILVSIIMAIPIIVTIICITIRLILMFSSWFIALIVIYWALYYATDKFF